MFAAGRGDRFQAVTEGDHAESIGLGPKYLGGRRVVSHPVDPGPHGTSAVESSKAPPERHMNLLQQVATSIWVTFIRLRKPFECGTERRGSLGIAPLLTGRTGPVTHSLQVVATRRCF